MAGVETLLIIGGTAIACALIFASVAAWAWTHWIRLRLRELELTHGQGAAQHPQGFHRIDLADLKERVRKLEAIASGVNF